MKGGVAFCFALCIVKVLSADPVPVTREEIPGLNISETQISIEQRARQDPILAKDITQTGQIFRASVLDILTASTNRIGSTGHELGRAIQDLSLGLLNNSIDLTRSIAYVPYLLAVDAPVHMLKMFVMLRDIGQIPLTLRDSVDVVERYVSETQHRDIMERLVIPFTSTPENVVNTVAKFFTSLISSTTRFIAGTQ